MSIRVHELASELSVKSKEILDVIKELGLLEKPSTFSGLQPEVADQLRDRFKGSSGDSPQPAAAQKEANAPPQPKKEKEKEESPAKLARPTSSPPETPAIRPPASGPPNQAAGTAPTPTPPVAEMSTRETVAPASTSPEPTKSPSPPAASGLTTAPAAPPRAQPATPVATPPAAPARGMTGAPVNPPAARPAMGTPGEAAPGTPATPAAGPRPAPASPAAPQAGPRPAPGGTAPSSGLSSPPRSGAGGGGGPLSRHTHHRGAGTTGSAPPGAGAPAQGQAPGPRPQLQPRQEMRGPGGQQSNAPLQRSDYISPTGTRPPLGRPQNLGQGPQQPRRDGPVSDPDGGRPRDGGNLGPRRPLPSVASPSMPPPGPRRPEQRPQQGGPEVKTQRPEVKYTREQLLQMRQTGEIGGNAAPVIPGRPGGPALRPGGTPSRFPSQPTGGVGSRPPLPPPGGGAPLARRPGIPLGPAAPAPPVTTEEEDDRKGKSGRLGNPADRAGRRAKRDARANDRRVTSPMPAAALIGDDDDGRQSRGSRKGGHKGSRQATGPQRKSHAEIEPPISVRTLSEAIGIKAADLIRKLMNNFNQLVNINANLEEESAQMLALEYGVELQIVHQRTAEDDLLDSIGSGEDEAEENLVARPPVVTILGHVDHGKTSLLDRIRRSNVVDSESGGITQHIGAYTVDHDGKMITFVDTPGHEAFTEMRARGANVTDIVVLVVAADDGVMPQTVEAIAHAKAADVPIIVALNKIDLPNVNINKIYGELSQHELAPEEYGGDTPVIKTSAVTGLGIDDLLEMIGIVAELKCDLRANPNKNASGTCLEALVSEGRGAIARVIVQDGTLHVGDIMVCGDGFGRVRALFNDKGRAIEAAGPSTPVEVSGLDAVPTAGEKFGVIDDITHAREIAETRRERTRGVQLGDRQSITLENLFDKMTEKKVKSLNLILKADVQGSLEALTKELEKLVNPEVPIRVLHKAVGGISESDILLADASQAIVIGFRVAPEDRAVTAADEKKIDIRRYDIIYQVTDEIKKAVEGMLVPEIKEVHLGRAVVRQLFKISKIGTVAGCFVTQGLIERSAKARVLRDGREIYKGGIEALKRFKDDVKEVRENFECGIKITNFDDLKSDDVIEAYRIDVIRRTL